MTSQPQPGLFVVDSVAPARDTQTLANEIVARIERDFARAGAGPRLASLPARFYERRRDTPFAVLRRVLYSLYFFAISA